MAVSTTNAKINTVVDNIQQKKNMTGTPLPQATKENNFGSGDMLGRLVSAIQSYQQANPVQTPFAPGTQTLSAIQADRDYELSKMNAETARQNSLKSGGGGKYSDTEEKNLILNSLVPGIINAKNSGTPLEQVTNELYGSIGELGPSVSTKDIDDLVLRLYGDYMGDDFPEEELTPEEIQRQALKERPWWQRAVDMLPGKQFR